MAAAVTGCGSPSPPPVTKTGPQILRAMKTLAESATSVRMTGSAKSGSTTLTFDLSFAGNTDVSGSVTEGTRDVTLEAVAGKTYIKLDQGLLSFAGLPASDCAAVCGKYLEVPAAEASQVTGSISLSALRKQLFQTIPSFDVDTSFDFVPGTFQGQHVLISHELGYTFDVASTGSPYPLHISDTKGDNVTFSEWNSVPALTPPPASEVISI